MRKKERCKHSSKYIVYQIGFNPLTGRIFTNIGNCKKCEKEWNLDKIKGGKGEKYSRSRKRSY